MNIERYRDFLLASVPSAKIASGGTEINCRCFYCPDSSDPKSRHFYISIPRSEDEPSMYDCKLCHSSGVVTNRTLMDWGVYDPNIAEDLIIHNRKASKKHRTLFQKVVYNVNNTFTTEDDTAKIKLDYFNQRIGTNLSFQDLRDLKVVLNLCDILKGNGITQLTRNPDIVSQLNANFLGFLSIDNSNLNMRRVCDPGLVYKTIDKRYVNYRIFDAINTDRFYTVPTSVDLSYPQRVKLHIAEGPFDILSIYLNCRQREPGIYSSVAGSNYYGSITNFIFNYRLPYVEVHLYPDNDKYGKRDRMIKLASMLSELMIPLYVHRNLYDGEKDFGVPPSRIRESIEKMN